MDIYSHCNTGMALDGVSTLLPVSLAGNLDSVWICQQSSDSMLVCIFSALQVSCCDICVLYMYSLTEEAALVDSNDDGISSSQFVFICILWPFL